MSTESTDLSFAVVFLVYGLALFALGEAVMLSARRSVATRFAASLKYLAAFAFLGAIASWIDAGLVLTDSLGSAEAQGFRILRIVLLALAGTCLLRFGAGLLATTRPANRWLVPASTLLLVAWLASLVIPSVGPVGGLASAGASCLECHSAPSSALITEAGNWVTAADVWAHYLLYCPGAILASVAFFAQRRRFLARGLPSIARHSFGAAVAFAVTAISAGLIVPPAPFFPASLLNYASFHAALRIPTQLVTTVATVIVAYSVVRTLRVFELERARQLAGARAARFAAQREVLEAQSRAQARMVDWNRQLEARVRERTRELEDLHVQLKDVAVLEERDRIARELHDSLAQALGYLGLRASVLEDLLVAGEREQAVVEVRRISEVVDDAYADVREAILGLRTRTSRQGIVPALQEYLRKYGLQTGIHAELRVAPGDDLRLAPSVEIQILRVVQEALANVRKHSRAERVVVRVWTDAGATCLAVEDDGRGFDPDVKLASGHFGLATMRERVHLVGGIFEVRSAPGIGTSVVVSLPRSDLPTADREGGGTPECLSSEQLDHNVGVPR